MGDYASSQPIFEGKNLSFVERQENQWALA